MFHVEVFVGDEMIAQGVGRTKKEAEQEGAKLALEAISDETRTQDQESGRIRSCAETSRPLFNFDPPATDEEVRAASLQFVRKMSGFTAPSKANEDAFNSRDRRDRGASRGGWSTISKPTRRRRIGKRKRRKQKRVRPNVTARPALKILMVRSIQIPDLDLVDLDEP